MNQYAANSFLKTLEEPVENLYFILVTSDINALLPTIVSRGERFPFFPLMENEFYYLVETVAEEFNFDGTVGKETAFKVSEGNPGVAKDIMELQSDLNEVKRLFGEVLEKWQLQKS